MVFEQGRVEKGEVSEKGEGREDGGEVRCLSRGGGGREEGGEVFEQGGRG